MSAELRTDGFTPSKDLPAADQSVGPSCQSLRLCRIALCFASIFVIGCYAIAAKSGWLEAWSVDADHTFYNLLVSGFSNGQLSLCQRAVKTGQGGSNENQPL